MIRSLAVFTIAALASISSAHATDRWVTVTGVATTPCSQASPCGTIAAARAIAVAGDNINVVSGSYLFSPWTSTTSGSVGNIILTRCTDASGTLARLTCLIRPVNGTSITATFWEDDGQYVTNDGFEIDGRSPAGPTIRIGYGSETFGAGPNIFQNGHVHHISNGTCQSSAGIIGDDYHSVSAVNHYLNNIVHDVGTTGANCNQSQSIYIASTGNTLNNIVYNCSGWCIQAWHGANTNNIINNTTFAGAFGSGNIATGVGEWYHGSGYIATVGSASANILTFASTTGPNGAIQDGWAPYSASFADCLSGRKVLSHTGTTVTLDGNIFCTIGGGNTIEFGPPWSGRVSNNIAINATNVSQGYGINAGAAYDPANSFYHNNLVSNNSVNYLFKNNLVSCTPNCVVAVPVFVNYNPSGTGNYHLQTGSPGIDQGSLTSAPATDIAGTSRPQNIVYDIGAYEYVTGSAPPAGCYDVGPAWQNIAIANQTGNFTFTFSVIPGTGVDSVIGLSTTAAAAFTDLAAIVAFIPSNEIQARNGGSYTADQVISWTAGLTYNFRLVVDITTHKYNVFVTPPASAELTLATNYDFRTEQAAAINLANVGINTDIGITSRICIIAVQTTPITTPTITKGPSAVLPKSVTYGYTVPVDGFSATFPSGITWLLLRPAASLASGTVTLPSAPAVAQQACISTSQNISGLSVLPASGNFVLGWANGSPLNATSKCWIFRKEDSSWYPNN